MPCSQSSPRSSGSSFQEITGSSSITGSPLSTSPMGRFLGVPYDRPSNTYGHLPSMHDSGGFPGHKRALSTTLTSLTPAIRVDPSIPVYL
ncbi:hypothetical protein SBOR_8452 [Sclerotinia borealis F-4128]|uniref:Uncharacterized protein n=1 Tax=Sclerotinia borealis (strain F-4128) TaxID=1432307 RepID=W9C9B2_SCLBF|nr:hypothetical protein SBOR_8452 [Sclerotinia borealis F-4128]